MTNSSVVDAARRLANANLVVHSVSEGIDENEFGRDVYACVVCDCEQHTPDCPVPMLPAIVAALEAAQVMVFYAVKCLNQSGDCPICPGDVTEHMDYCPVGPLLEAYGYRAEDM